MDTMEVTKTIFVNRKEPWKKNTIKWIKKVNRGNTIYKNRKIVFKKKDTKMCRNKNK